MLDDQFINPYAPTVTENSLGVKISAPVPDASLFARTPWVLLMTFMGISVSGAFFGCAAMLTAVLAERGIDAAPAIAIGFTFGAFYAAFVAIPVLFVGWLISIPMRSRGITWLPGQTRAFATVCGFCVGFLSIAAPFGFESESLLFGLVPGLVGMLGTWLIVERFAIRRSIQASRTIGAGVGTLSKGPAGT
jgi:hypothetical protein